MHNLLWVNQNPRPETICERCLPFIGKVFKPGTELPLPAHPNCYCIYFPTDQDVTPWDWDSVPSETRWTWVLFVAWMLLTGIAVAEEWPSLAPLIPDAEEHNQQREEEREGETMSPPPPTDHQPLPTHAEPVKLTTGHVRLAQQSQPGPRRYECTLIQAGENKNGWNLPVEVLGAALTKFNGAPCQIDHPGFFEMPSLKSFAGTFETPSLVGDQVAATLRLAETPSGDLLQNIFDAWLDDLQESQSVADIGLSAVLWLTFDRLDGKRVAKEILHVESVDAVLHPAAGGRVQRILNQFTPSEQPGSLDNFAGAFPHRRSIIMPENTIVSDNGGNQPEPSPPPEPAAVPAPDLHGQVNQLAGVIEQMSQQLDRLTAVVADQAADTTVQGMGQPPRDNLSIRMGRTGLEQVETALESLLDGVKPPDGIQPLSGIRELYMLLSGDFEMTGRYHPDRVYLANVNSSTMAGLVANRLNKVVVNQFMNYPQWWAPIVTVVDFSTLQDARWITLGGVGELPTVAEGAAYTELTWDDNTETAAFVKKGGYLGITIEAIDKDDTRQLRMAPLALAQAAWLTLGKSISSIFTSNSDVGPTLADSIALFNASHSNLGSTALSHAAWVTTRQAMRDQTELNSSEALGALTAPKFLLVPNELEVTALQVLATEHVPGSGNWNENPFAVGNVHDARLEAAQRRVIVIDLWTDANNWAAVADPNLYPSIGVGFRYGRTPEIYSVASPTAGLMFSNDVMPVKVRYFYATGPIDHRGLYKHNV